MGRKVDTSFPTSASQKNQSVNVVSQVDSKVFPLLQLLITASYVAADV